MIDANDDPDRVVANVVWFSDGSCPTCRMAFFVVDRRDLTEDRSAASHSHSEDEIIHLIDGGIANNTPISDAAELGATKVYVLPTGIPCEVSTAPRGAIPMLIHSITLLTNQRLAEDIERWRGPATTVVDAEGRRPFVLPARLRAGDELCV